MDDVVDILAGKGVAKPDEIQDNFGTEDGKGDLVCGISHQKALVGRLSRRSLW